MLVYTVYTYMKRWVFTCMFTITNEYQKCDNSPLLYNLNRLMSQYLKTRYVYRTTALPPNSLVFSVLPFAFYIYGPPFFSEFFAYIYLISKHLRFMFCVFSTNFSILFFFFFSEKIRIDLDNIYVT